MNKITFIIPTKDRPKQLCKCMRSLSIQAKYVDEVIVVASGTDVKKTVLKFSDRMNVQYIHSNIHGQVVQRNIGINRIANSVKLVGFLDDDIILYPDALKKMISFWKNTNQNTAGVGFNLINSEQNPHPTLYHLLKKVTNSEPGSVNRFGISIPINNISCNIRTQFLGGGYTIWKRDILMKYSHENIYTRWAQGEDLRFSYPISKQYPLYVCADSKVYEENEQIIDKNVKTILYQARITALSQLYFTSLYKELSTTLAIFLLIARMFVNFITPQRQFYGLGQLNAISQFLKHKISSNNLLDLLND